MKALKYQDTWNVAVSTVATLEPTTPDDVIVNISWCGICGTDTGIITGDYPVAVPGVTLGHEATGVVSAIGDKVANVKVGDKVVINPTYYCGKCHMCQTMRINHCINKMGTESGVSYDGCFAHQFKTTSAFVMKIPDGVSLQAATLTEPLSCALSGIRKIHNLSMLTKGIVIGAGPMGLLYTWGLFLRGIIVAVIETANARYDYARREIPEAKPLSHQVA